MCWQQYFAGVIYWMINEVFNLRSGLVLYKNNIFYEVGFHFPINKFYNFGFGTNKLASQWCRFDLEKKNTVFNINALRSGSDSGSHNFVPMSNNIRLIEPAS